MADVTLPEDPLPPPTTISIRALRSHEASRSTTRSRSHTPSRTGSRTVSVRPLGNDNPASARRSLSPLTNAVKREHSTDDGGGEPDPGPSSLRLRERNGLPSAKRRRLDTDSVEDLLAAADDSLSSSMLFPELENVHETAAVSHFTDKAATPVENDNADSSHTTESGTHVGQSIGPRNEVETIDVDSASAQQEADVEVPAHVLPSASASSQSSTPKGSPSNVAEPSPEPAVAPPPDSERPKASRAEPLASYSCPICFSPPRFPTMPPCGHICCGECLFTAVKSTIERSQFHGPPSDNAKAPIPGWDGMGGGVTGLKPHFTRRNKNSSNKDNGAGAADNDGGGGELGSSKQVA
ncbi:hypothetical protein EIP86_000699 [Pleurotus ostreatoroseus]|nr:hypothetical protein EIP86_000699 [Pleurotus ostreatoroseus]